MFPKTKYNKTRKWLYLVKEHNQVYDIHELNTLNITDMHTYAV